MMNILKYYSDKMYDLSVRIEKIYSLTGDINSNDDLKLLVEMHTQEIKKTMKLKFKDFDDFVEKIEDSEKYGLLAEVSQLQFKRTSVISYSSAGVREIIFFYAESYEDLLKKIIKYSEKYHNKFMIRNTENNSAEAWNENIQH